MTAPDPRLDEIQARLSAATPGPWVWTRSRPFGPDVPPRFELVKPVILGEFNGIPMHGHPLNICKSDNEWQPNDSDAEFIANAPTDVSFLLDELRKAREALERVEALHQREVIAVHEGYGEEAICTECGHRWPCDTRAAVAAAKGDERG